MHGVLIVDKPAGPTSHDVVARVRRAVGISRIGHTGTLDPLATGVLALVIGRATRLAQFLSTDEKEYVAGVRLGWATATYDAEERTVRGERGELIVLPPQRPAPDVGEADVRAALTAFVGSYRTAAAALLRQEDRRHAGVPAGAAAEGRRVEAGRRHRQGARARRAGRRAWPRCGSSARAGSTSARWPTISVSGLAAARISNRCAARAPATSRPPRQRRSTSSRPRAWRRWPGSCRCRRSCRSCRGWSSISAARSGRRTGTRSRPRTSPRATRPRSWRHAGVGSDPRPRRRRRAPGDRRTGPRRRFATRRCPGVRY